MNAVTTSADERKRMPILLQTTILLILSNVFMTFAWYAHLKDMKHPAVVHGGGGELGNRVLRVHDSGAGQPHRRSRRPGPAAAQDPARSRHPDGVHSLRPVLHEQAAVAGLRVGGLVPVR